MMMEMFLSITIKIYFQKINFINYILIFKFHININSTNHTG